MLFRSHAPPTSNLGQATFVSRPPSLLNGLMWGVGMGAGSEIGHSAVRAITGGRDSREIHEESKHMPQSQAAFQESQSQQMNHPCAEATLSFLNVNLEYIIVFKDECWGYSIMSKLL